MSSNAFGVIAPYIERKFMSARWKREDSPDHTNVKYMSARPKEQAVMDQNDTHARLRLDWELDRTMAETAPWTKIKKLMVAQMSLDIADLIVNGDTDSLDPLLKTMDGEIKRGQRMVDFQFTEVQMFREFHARKDTYEYTCYTVIYPVFE